MDKSTLQIVCFTAALFAGFFWGWASSKQNSEKKAQEACALSCYPQPETMRDGRCFCDWNFEAPNLRKKLRIESY